MTSPVTVSERDLRTDRFLFVRGVKSLGKTAASPPLFFLGAAQETGHSSGLRGAPHRACARRPAAARRHRHLDMGLGRAAPDGHPAGRTDHRLHG
jgi:hypothetical protein